MFCVLRKNGSVKLARDRGTRTHTLSNLREPCRPSVLRYVVSIILSIFRQAPRALEELGLSKGPKAESVPVAFGMTRLPGDGRHPVPELWLLYKPWGLLDDRGVGMPKHFNIPIPIEKAVRSI